MPTPWKSEAEFRRGALSALGAALLFGISPPLAKLLVGELSPILLAGLLYLGSGIGLGTASLVSTGSGARPLDRSDVKPLAIAIVFGGLVGPVLLMSGLRITSASASALLLNLEGVFTALLAWCVFKEHFTRRIGLGMLFITFGGIVLSLGQESGGSTWYGELLVCGACLAWAIDNNFTRKVADANPIHVAALKGLFAGVTNTAIGTFIALDTPESTSVLSAMALGVACYGISLSLFVIALRYIGSARTGAYFSTAPFVGAVLAYCLGEPVTVSLGLAAALMGAGVWLHLTEPRASDAE